MKTLLGIIALVTLISACATSPLGRHQLILFPDDELDAMGAAAFNKIKFETIQTRDRSVTDYVTCVADAIIRGLPGGNPNAWEILVFGDDQVNAFALPGRKVGVYKGLLKAAKNQNQLAAVIGHEIAHVQARHTNERVSTHFATDAGLRLVAVASGSSAQQRELFGLLGVGAQVGVLLPFNRAQEKEADLIGLDFIATAGFDPQQSVALWQNMGAEGGVKPPEFISTHPSGKTRIAELNKRMPQAMELYRSALDAGRKPTCEEPSILAR